jgi:primosomal protein N' (replication factor Y)
VGALVAPEGSTIVVVPDGQESKTLAAELEREGRDVLVMRNDTGDAERTSAWADARRGACVVVGGRVASFAPVPDLAAVIVLDDLDEALEEERAPTWDAPSLLRERARRAGARFEVVSPAPGTAMTVAAAVTASAARDAERAGWARLEVVDVRYEPPGKTLLSARLADALRRTSSDGARALCVLNRRGRARLLVCGSCSEVARCGRCGAAVQEGREGLECSRCGTTAATVCAHCGSAALRPRRLGVMRVREHLAALVPHTRVVAVEAGSAPLPAFDVAIGTEAVLHRVAPDPGRPVRLVAFLDMDQELVAPRYRAEEQALWLLIRACRQVGERSDGGVVLAQTRMPEHPVLVAARDADPAAVLSADLERRRDLGYPPFGGLAELSGDVAAVGAAVAALAVHESLRILGPSDGRALVRSRALDALCDAFASTDLGPARGLGRLRVDVDPRRV